MFTKHLSVSTAPGPVDKIVTGRFLRITRFGLILPLVAAVLAAMTMNSAVAGQTPERPRSPVITVVGPDGASGGTPGTVPEFEMTDLAGRRYSRESLRGRVVVLNFWFIACGPCRAEMPQLNQLVSEFASEKVVFLAPATDRPAELRRFLRRNKFDYQVVPQAEQLIRNVFANRIFPTHIVIDQNGAIVSRFYGASEDRPEQLRQVLRRLTGG